MERYIRTQSSPPSSPASSARPGPGPGPGLSSSHHSQPQPGQPQPPHYQGEARQQHPRPPQQPHYPLGGEMRNGTSASTSSLDRVISPAKVKTEEFHSQPHPHSSVLPRWPSYSPKAPPALCWRAVRTPGEVQPRVSTVCRSRQTT